MNPVFIFILLLGFISIIALFLSGGSSSSSLAQKRLKSFEELDLGAGRKKASMFPDSASSAHGAWPGGSVFDKKRTERTSSLISGGGNPQNQLIMLGIVIVTAAFVLLLVNRGVLPRQVQNVLPFGVLAILVPRMIRIVQIKKIQKKFSEQFPTAIHMMMNSLRAGHDIRSSFEMVSEDMPSPSKEEFSHILQELNVGVTLDVALSNFQKRM